MAGLLIVLATLLHPPRETAKNDRCQRVDTGRGACGLHGCLVAGAARASRTLCGSLQRDGTTRSGGVLDRFLGDLSDRG